MDFDHPGSDDPRRIVTEQAWIKANGRRIVDLAQAGAIEQGAGIIWIHWYMDLDPERQYNDRNFKYETREFYSAFLDRPEFQTNFDFDPAMYRKWEQIVETHDPEQSVVILIVGWIVKVQRYDASHYLVGMRGGGPLRWQQRGQVGPLVIRKLMSSLRALAAQDTLPLQTDPSVRRGAFWGDVEARQAGRVPRTQSITASLPLPVG